MSATPSYDRWAASVVENGLACASCGAEFTEAHGFRVACSFCFARLTPAEIASEGVRLAQHPEKNRSAWEQIGRQRKSVKQARLERASKENAE